MLVSGWGPALNKCFNPQRCIHGGLLICSPISQVSFFSRCFCCRKSFSPVCRGLWEGYWTSTRPRIPILSLPHKTQGSEQHYQLYGLTQASDNPLTAKLLHEFGLCMDLQRFGVNLRICLSQLRCVDMTQHCTMPWLLSCPLVNQENKRISGFRPTQPKLPAYCSLFSWKCLRTSYALYGGLK